MSVRLLLTGANGFVGSAIGRAAAVAGWSVTGLVRRPVESLPNARICDYSRAALTAVIQELDPQYVAHAAGAASVGGSLADPDADFAGSVSLTQRLLESIRKSARRPALLYISSAAVYGNPVSLPVAEDAALRPISPYGFHKMMCERLIEEYASWFGQPGLCVRAFSLMGEAQRRLLVWDVFRRAMAGGTVTLSGTGEESRDYLHVEDLARLLLEAATRREQEFEVLNLSSGRATTVREVAERILVATGKPGPLKFTGEVRAGDPKEWRADITRLKKRLGPLVLPAFEERLAQLVKAWRAKGA